MPPRSQNRPVYACKLGEAPKLVGRFETDQGVVDCVELYRRFGFVAASSLTEVRFLLRQQEKAVQ
jgi:hypothetical protein